MDVYLWAGLCIGCLIVEALTVNLVSIWFAVGALLSMIAAAAGLNGAWQLGIFCIGSAVMIAGLRPMAKRLLKKTKGEHLNADRVIGKTAVVREAVNNLEGTGSVICSGMTWTARAADDSEIFQPYEPAKVLRIEGAKLIIEKERKEDKTYEYTV